jgi:uncharacterized protein
MRLLIDIGHPAHVHLFKNLAHTMMNKGHRVHFILREKECEIALLEHEGFEYTNSGKHYHSTTGKIWGLLKFTFLTIRTSFKFKPDIFLSHGSMYAAWAAFFFRKPNISLEDTGNREQVRLYLPFTKVVLTSTSFPLIYGKKQVQYEGFHELAYLKSNYFTPDKTIIHELGLAENERYFILRFVSWSASHDIGHNGISPGNKVRLIAELSKYGKVFITSEKQLSRELEQFRIQIAPEKILDAIAFSSLLYGESATMASEAAMMGVPSIYLDNTGRYYTTELEKKYGLVFNFSESEEDQKKSIDKAVELIKSNNLTPEWAKRREKMLKDKIDVTAFLVWFIENWPESFSIMKKNPDYQYNFK